MLYVAHLYFISSFAVEAYMSCKGFYILEGYILQLFFHTYHSIFNSSTVGGQSAERMGVLENRTQVIKVKADIAIGDHWQKQIFNCFGKVH